jgi:hypothetical protein
VSIQEKKKPEMTPEELVDLLQLLESTGIEVWLDGGWAVDGFLVNRHDHILLFAE